MIFVHQIKSARLLFQTDIVKGKAVVASQLDGRIITLVRTTNSEEEIIFIQGLTVETASAKVIFSAQEGVTRKEPALTMNTSHNSVLINLQVRNLAESLPDLLTFFNLKTAGFKAGQISLKLTKWRKITSDAEVLCTVAGEKIEFTSLPQQNNYKVNKFSEQEDTTIAQEVQQLLAKGVIVESPHEKGEFISPIFLRPKPDGSHRLILNLKKLNEKVVYRHFKLD